MALGRIAMGVVTLALGALIIVVAGVSWGNDKRENDRDTRLCVEVLRLDDGQSDGSAKAEWIFEQILKTWGETPSQIVIKYQAIDQVQGSDGRDLLTQLWWCNCKDAVNENECRNKYGEPLKARNCLMRVCYKDLVIVFFG